MNILVDTDYLVALTKGDDANHAKALEKARQHIGLPLYITTITIPEAATVISNKISHQAAKEFVMRMRKEPFREILLNRSLVKQADSIFLSQSKKGISWIDCLNVAAIKTYQLNGILSFDSFYRKQGIKMM